MTPPARTVIETAATSGPVFFDVEEARYHQWIREWRDLGRLIYLREAEVHAELHDVKPVAWCECFYCRVQRAWERRFDVPKKRKPRTATK